jgi:hypothetical protein
MSSSSSLMRIDPSTCCSLTSLPHGAYAPIRSVHGQRRAIDVGGVGRAQDRYRCSHISRFTEPALRDRVQQPVLKPGGHAGRDLLAGDRRKVWLNRSAGAILIAAGAWLGIRALLL